MSDRELTPAQKRVHHRLQTDLRYFCMRALKIKLKEGGHGPFIWNKAQEYLHARIEDQLRRIGMVRMFIIKGRQQGISTYIAARFYWKATRKRGQNVFILSHHSSTTETLFQIVSKYHESCPPEITPELITDNNRRMEFTNASRYTVGTAGSGSIGRGDTNQFLHWSEVAFCDNTDEILTGLDETVADVDGTEKLNESTANGIGNYFHKGVLEAVEGKGLYEVVFIPWYWQDEYRSRITDAERKTWELTPEEQTLKELYELDDEQIKWRRNKIAKLKSERLFKQEYPFTIQEAFQASGASFIDAEKVAIAQKSTLTDINAPLVLGVDPARVGDRTCITWRQGRHWIKTDVYQEMDEMLLAGKLARIIDRYNVAKVFIDVALGYGTVDRLHELGYQKIVTGVHFSQQPAEPEIYLNKRAEMAFALRDWVHEGGVRIPATDEVTLDLGAIPDFKESSRGLLQLESKDKIKEKFGKSTDIFDSAMLTFAEPVRSEIQTNRRNMKTANTKGGSALKARRHQTKNSKDWQEADWDEYDPRDGSVKQGLRNSRRR